MLNCQKQLFSLAEEVHYINCATMSPNLKAVEQAGVTGIMRKNQPHKITQETFFETTDPVKKLFAKLIYCNDFERIALIPSTSYGMAIVAENMRHDAKITAGQEIIIVEGEFPSDVYAWEAICKEKNLKIKTINPPEKLENRGKIWNESLLNSINENTCLVVMSPIHWADGTLFDIETIGNLCKINNSLYVLDGAQSGGALEIDITKCKPDAFINVGYKWLLGPYSLGVAYFGSYFDNGKSIENNWINRVGSEDFSKLINYNDSFRPKADRYNVGERSNFILNPMLEASLTQILDWGVNNIQLYCKDLLSESIIALKNKGFIIEEDKYRSHHLFGIRLPKNIKIDTIKKELLDRNVIVSYRGDAIRISPHVYNDKNDIALLTEGLLASC
jgi:selenocysteine lyase/cysteine desulfurase